MDEGRIVLVVLGVIFWVVRALLKSDKNKTKNKPVPKKATPSKSSSGKTQNIDDIFKDFVKELEKKKQPTTQRTITKPAAVKKEAAKSNTLDWQAVERTHIKPKKQLIDHEDYHGTLSTEATSIAESEGEVYSFDAEEVDFRDIIIGKEILDRKYT